MRPLTLALGGLLTAFTVLLWLCARFSDSAPTAQTAFPSISLGAAQFTPAAKRPPVGLPSPIYRITSLGRYSEPDTIWGQPDNRLPCFAPLPSYLSASSVASNKHGQIVGLLRLYRDGAWLNIQDHGFLWQRGRMHNLGSLPGCQISHAVAISDKGVIVGDALIDSFPADSDVPGHAVCWIGRKIRDLGTGEATAVNDSGSIVGDSGKGGADCSNEPHALLWKHGYRYDLNGLVPKNSAWVLEEATGIDNLGRILGHGTFIGQPHAFLLTPAGLRRFRSE